MRLPILFYCFLAVTAGNVAQQHFFDFTETEESNFFASSIQETVSFEENLLVPGSSWQQLTSAVTETCCNKIRISLKDKNVRGKQEERQGVYTLTTFNHNNKAEYHQEGGSNIVYFYRNKGWYVGGDYDTAGLQSDSSATCPVEQTLWRFWRGDGEGWSEHEDGKIQISCFDASIGESLIPSEETLVGEGFIPRSIDGPNDDCSSYSYENLPHPRIILLGATGVGKSVLSNQLMGCYYKDESCKEFSVGHGSLSHTNETAYRYGNYLGKGRCVTIIDTPGVLDFSDRDYAHAMEIVNVVKNDVKVIDVFLLLFDGSKPRFQRPVVELLKLYQSMFSPEIWKNTITEFTFWKHDENTVEERLEEQEMDEQRKHKEWNQHYKEKVDIPIEIPSIFIDPVFPIFSKKDSHIRKVERQVKAKSQFQYYTYLLMDLAMRMPSYSCQGQCNAPDEFFLGAPVMKMDHVAGRENAHVMVYCQIWKGYQGQAADNYQWKFNGETIYEKQTVQGQDLPTIVISPEWENKIQVEESLSPGALHFVEIQFSFLTFERSFVGTYSLDNGHQSLRNSVELLLMTDGYWGPWEEWQPCSKTCVQELENPGLRQRRRACIEPENGGLPCKSYEEIDTEVCAGDGQEMRFCPIDYSFMEWSDWSTCSHNCGNGVSTRSRLCNQGRYGGRMCISLEEKQERSCYKQACTAQQNTGCIMLEWGRWTACTKTCLDRSNPQYGTRTRQREYKESDPSNPQCIKGSEIIQIDRNCAGYNDQIEECPRDSAWSQWSEFSTCSVTCGKKGEQSRYRSCNEGNTGGQPCSALSEPQMESISCYSGPCPLDCQWTIWGNWEQCDRNYGYGKQIRRRNIFVVGQHGGVPCQQSDSFEQKECVVQVPRCRVEEWTEWIPAVCPKTVGQHSQTRERAFINEGSKFTGYDCSEKEKDVETRLCQGCPAGWHYVINGDEHNCYRVLRDIPRNWTESRDACRQSNGYLAEITSQAENDAVLKYLRDYEDVDVWIGLNDREKESHFEWSKSKNKLGVFSYWETIYSREPNNGHPHWGEEDCVFLYARALSANRKWNDLNCKDNSEANVGLYALCEYDFDDFAVKDCVYEDQSYRYCKVGVKPGTTLQGGSVAKTCKEVGMEAVCSGNQRCKYYSPDCIVTPLSTKCYAPMYTLSYKICTGRQPRECPALEGVFSHMKGLSGGECGVVGKTWCAKGNDITTQFNRQHFAYCAERKESKNKPATQCRLPYEALNQSWRKAQPGTSGDRNSCHDRSYSFKKQWYRFSEPAGIKMLTAPSTYEGFNNICSHDRAGWLNGAHPNVGEEPVTRKICFASLDFGQDCQWSVEAQVVACQEETGSPFYLYELPPTPQCPLVYCTQ